MRGRNPESENVPWWLVDEAANGMRSFLCPLGAR